MAKHRRLPNTRRALTPDELAEINVAARSSGNDVVLGALLPRLHTETACRRGGALTLRVMDPDRAAAEGHWRQALALFADIGAPGADHVRVLLGKG